MISEHADHIPSHWRFPRTMSREMAALPWEHRMPALKPWGYYAIAAGLLALLALGWR